MAVLQLNGVQKQHQFINNGWKLDQNCIQFLLPPVCWLRECKQRQVPQLVSFIDFNSITIPKRWFWALLWLDLLNILGLEFFFFADMLGISNYWTDNSHLSHSNCLNWTQSKILKLLKQQFDFLTIILICFFAKGKTRGSISFWFFLNDHVSVAQYKPSYYGETTYFSLMGNKYRLSFSLRCTNILFNLCSCQLSGNSLKISQKLKLLF